jgi:hypothetical protein
MSALSPAVIAACVSIEPNEIGINRLEGIVLGKVDFFFDFGDKALLGEKKDGYDDIFSDRSTEIFRTAAFIVRSIYF